MLSCASVEARPLAVIKASGKLKVGLTGDYAPYSLRGADGGIASKDDVDAWLKKRVAAGDYRKALAAAADDKS